MTKIEENTSVKDQMPNDIKLMEASSSPRAIDVTPSAIL